MRWIVAGVLVGLSLCIATTACAQSSPAWASEKGNVSQRSLESVSLAVAPPTLTLEEALRLGFANNSGFRSDISSLLSAQASLRVTRQLYSLTLSAGTQRNHDSDGEDYTTTDAQALLGLELTTGAAVSVSATLSRLDSEESSVLSVAVTQPLLRGAGRSSDRYEALRSAYSSYRSALLSYFVARQSLAMSVITGYFGVVRTKDQVAIQEEALARTERAVKDAEARLAEGMTTRIEVTRAQLSKASTGLSLNSARLSYINQMDSFLQTLGLQVGALPELTTRPIYQPAPLDMEKLVQQALQDRAEVAVTELALADADASLRISRNQRRPQLDLYGASTHTGDGDSASGWQLGISASLPIASRSLAEAVRSAERRLLIAQRGREELRQSIATGVREQVHALRSQESAIGIQEDSVKIAREQLRLATISVEEGVGAYRDKVEAQEAVTDAERDLLNAHVEYFFDTLYLRRAVGQDVLQGLAAATTNAPAAAPGN